MKITRIAFLVLLTVTVASTVTGQTAPTASLNTSATAEAGNKALAAAKTDQVSAPGTPPDHWLFGTSNVKDMVPATLAPEAPRKLLREYGPAYLEQIGTERVLHLKGTHYEMGFQHGKLMKEEIEAGSTILNVVGTVSWEGDFIAGLREAWKRTAPFIPQKFKDEIKGLADATGLPVEQVQDFTIFPELFHCSGFAIWGKATADGELLHGRVLDYMRDAGLDKYALIIIQEPKDANAFVNVAYSGMLGSVTGMNDKQVAIGEMGGRGAEKWDGMPMSFLIRECLETANTLEDVMRIMKETPRTCEYYYVISDAKADNGRGSARGVAAVPESCQFIGPNEFNERLPRPMEDAVLLSAGDRYQCLADRAQKMYGKFTPKEALDLMARGVSMESNMHNALFKPKTMELWVANSTVEQPGCNRPYRYYDVRKLISDRP